MIRVVSWIVLLDRENRTIHEIPLTTRTGTKQYQMTNKNCRMAKGKATGYSQTDATRWRGLDQRLLKFIGHLKRTEALRAESQI